MRVVAFEKAMVSDFRQFFLDSECSDFYSLFFEFYENLRILLVHGYYRDNNIALLVDTFNEAQCYILDPIFQQINDAAIPLTKNL
jgi:hypothetical protein